MRLYEPSELQQLQQDLPYLNQVADWTKNFLAKPHPDLGRSGSVCPFVPKALLTNTIHIAAIRTQNLEPHEIEELVYQYRNTFLELEPQTGSLTFYKAIMLVFPDLPEAQASEIVDGIQRKLKPAFVKEGLMIGEFHPWNESPGLHNPDFRPLRSPIPMLAIRFMAESDLPFLERLTDEPHLRVQYLEAYLKRLEGVAKDEENLSQARRSLEKAYAQLSPSEKQDATSRNRSLQTRQNCPFAGILNFFKRLSSLFSVSILRNGF